MSVQGGYYSLSRCVSTFLSWQTDGTRDGCDVSTHASRSGWVELPNSGWLGFRTSELWMFRRMASCMGPSMVRLHNSGTPLALVEELIE